MSSSSQAAFIRRAWMLPLVSAPLEQRQRDPPNGSRPSRGRSTSPTPTGTTATRGSLTPGCHTCRGAPDPNALDLGGAKINGRGLARVRGATKLTWLRLEGTSVADAGFAHHGGRTDLTDLSLPRTPVTDAAVETLPGFCKLVTVVLTSTGVSRRGGERLRSGLPGCRVVRQPPA